MNYFCSLENSTLQKSPFRKAHHLYKTQMAEKILKPKHSRSHCFHAAKATLPTAASAPPAPSNNTRTALVAWVGADRAGLSSCETARSSVVLLQIQPLFTPNLTFRDPIHSPCPPPQHTAQQHPHLSPMSRRAEGRALPATILSSPPRGAQRLPLPPFFPPRARAFSRLLSAPPSDPEENLLTERTYSLKRLQVLYCYYGAALPTKTTSPPPLPPCSHRVNRCHCGD